MSKLEIIGYVDEDGFNYCLRHGNKGMEIVYNNGVDTLHDKCSVCGEYLDVATASSK